MLKLIGIVFVIGSFTGIGIAQRQQYQGRVTTLCGLLSALDLIAGELSFRLTSIPDIIALLANDRHSSVSELFSSMNHAVQQDNGLSLTYKWMKTFQQNGPQFGLNADDIAVLCDMSDFIGKYDVKSQEQSVRYAKQRLEQQLKLAEAELKSKGTVYRTCCIAAGLLLVLVLL
ncbi:MAG: stage III sporulation protein AB [Butyricicoccus sp.]